MSEQLNINVIIAEDHPIFIEGLKHVLSKMEQANCTIHSVARTGEEAVKAVKQRESDILLMDMNLPDMDGMEILEKIKHYRKSLYVIALTMYDDPKIVKGAFKAGIDGYILKGNDPEEIERCFIAIMKGDTFMGKGVYLNSNQANKDKVRTKFQDKFIKRNNLTKRELEILQHISMALSNKQIAKVLYISDQTVSVHRKNIMRKLGVSNTAGLIKVAMDNALI